MQCLIGENDEESAHGSCRHVIKAEKAHHGHDERQGPHEGQQESRCHGLGVRDAPEEGEPSGDHAENPVAGQGLEALEVFPVEAQKKDSRRQQRGGARKHPETIQ